MSSGFYRSSRLQSENKRKRKVGQILEPCLRTKQAVELILRETVVPIVTSALGTVPKGLEKGTGIIGNQRKNAGSQDYRIV